MGAAREYTGSITIRIDPHAGLALAGERIFRSSTVFATDDRPQAAHHSPSARAA